MKRFLLCIMAIAAICFAGCGGGNGNDTPATPSSYIQVSANVTMSASSVDTSASVKWYNILLKMGPLDTDFVAPYSHTTDNSGNIVLSYRKVFNSISELANSGWDSTTKKLPVTVSIGGVTVAQPPVTVQETSTAGGVINTTVNITVTATSSDTYSIIVNVTKADGSTESPATYYDNTPTLVIEKITATDESNVERTLPLNDANPSDYPSNIALNPIKFTVYLSAPASISSNLTLRADKIGATTSSVTISSSNLTISPSTGSQVITVSYNGSSTLKPLTNYRVTFVSGDINFNGTTTQFPNTFVSFKTGQ
ncbi:MAG: hypothetical protein HQM08_00855 [Candidatus Riflebacteria bacterium]|nr:hypothetical protein [Candidatus Riflebacteria bacterium]